MKLHLVTGHIGSILCCELGALRGAKKIFKILFVHILRAPQVFFDVNPKGRILDRLSNDIYKLDVILRDNLRICFTTLYRVC